MVAEVCSTAIEFVSEKKIASMPPPVTIHSSTKKSGSSQCSKMYGTTISRCYESPNQIKSFIDPKKIKKYNFNKKKKNQW